MRRPRIEDYDANANLPELATPLDGMPVIGKPPQKNKDESPPPLSEKLVIKEAQGKKVKQNGILSTVPPAEANKRPVKPRHGFDIYVDQYEQLVKWSNDEKLQGGTGSMSRMAREALDMYIAARKKK